ncbi:kinase-like domain-containing protein [Desarmillaria tabescens]|uniref:non-specific serine/threonine protein kinase n=1 Tax=Armillaria tabescens TaxID=1929756 RepID=A0AA39JM33_ARMTA|nr:kinase-like domain-containing protein [Desarmillaria tabescens]KAK0444236.1 kinase-like domain-containing protein [Desarmillaria tabescens]
MLSGVRRFLPTGLSKKSSPKLEVLLYFAQEGNVLQQRYSLVRQLGEGFGRRSTVWLSKDLVTGNDVVLKITGADSTDAGKYSQLEAVFLDKVRQVRNTTEQQHVIHMLDHFPLISAHGLHCCLVLEPLGLSIEELTRRTLPNKFPIPMCRQIIKQTLLGLDYLHRRCGIVHTDLKLDNFLLRPSDTRGIPTLGGSNSLKIDLSQVSLGPSAVVISDLGVASHIEKPFKGVIQPFALRAPEVYLGIPYGSSADIWSMGCLSFQLVTYCWLFNPKAGARWSQDDDILGQMVSLNGVESFPVDVLARGKFSDKYFDKFGNLRGYNVGADSIQNMLDSRFRLQPEDEPELFADMLSRMLRLRPEDRESASELLSHPWLRDA